MTILHIYDESNSMAAHYVAMLNAQFSLPNLPFSIFQSQFSVATNAVTFKMMFDEQHPDIIHLHGKAPFALPQGIRLVVTPHGEYSGPLGLAALLSKEQLTAKSQQPFVVIARSQMEHDALIEQYPRVETILNPIITRTTTPEVCARQMLLVYQRVMCSNVLQLMDDDTRHTLALIMGAAIAGDARWVAQKPSHWEEDGKGLSLLYLYAEYENLLPLLEEGLRLLSINTNSSHRESIKGYLPEGYKKPQPMEGCDIISLLNDVKSNGPTLLRLTEIARALRADSLDEQQLLQRLDDHNMRSFFASILQLLSEQVCLTEGFMPCPPADNRETQQLRQSLYSHGCI
jgi:hypothetical protein